MEIFYKVLRISYNPSIYGEKFRFNYVFPFKFPLRFKYKGISLLKCHILSKQIRQKELLTNIFLIIYQTTKLPINQIIRRSMVLQNKILPNLFTHLQGFFDVPILFLPQLNSMISKIVQFDILYSILWLIPHKQRQK